MRLLGHGNERYSFHCCKLHGSHQNVHNLQWFTWESHSIIIQLQVTNHQTAIEEYITCLSKSISTCSNLATKTDQWVVWQLIRLCPSAFSRLPTALSVLALAVTLLLLCNVYNHGSWLGYCIKYLIVKMTKKKKVLDLGGGHFWNKHCYLAYCMPSTRLTRSSLPDINIIT